MIDKKNIWNKILHTIENENNKENEIIIKNILNNENITKDILGYIFSFKNIINLINENNLFYLFFNNEIPEELIFHLFPKSMIARSIYIFIKKINNKNINKLILKEKYIEFFIDKKKILNFKELQYILMNYQLKTEIIDMILKNNYLNIFNTVHDDLINIENFYLEIENFDEQQIKKIFISKKNLFIYFLKQKKLNDNIKIKMQNEFYINLKIIILYSIKYNRNVIYRKYLKHFSNIEFETIVEYNDYIENFFNILEKKIMKKQLNLFKFNKVKKLYNQYLFFNEEYKIENDFEYYLENNIKEIDYYNNINIEYLLELLETFIYEEEIDKIIYVFKLLLNKEFNKKEIESLLNILTHEYFYDVNDIITINFRNIFVSIFNKFNFSLDYYNEEELRLAKNIQLLYEKIYYKNMNYKNMKYVIENIKKNDLFEFLYRNEIIEMFFKSPEVKNFTFDELKNFIINYINKINIEKIEYNDLEKEYIKYKLLSYMLENENIDKNYHFKFYQYYSDNLLLKNSLLKNNNLSIIVLYKVVNNIKNINILLKNKNIW